jgi:zinc D-Ala-D-Ala carboxypeptidase
MNHTLAPRPLAHRTRGPLVAALFVVALSTVACGVMEPESSDDLPDGKTSETHEVRTPDRPLAPPPDDVPAEGGSSDPFDVDSPAIARLDPDLLEAVQAAAKDARADGVPMVVTSGWRSSEHQQRLYDEAVEKYGSEEEARRYVATPDSSAHVTGDAVDIGPTDATSWLSQHGDNYGLCQTFANEMWHYELSTVPGGECPPMLPDGSSRN